jgi:hypothetical protein
MRTCRAIGCKPYLAADLRSLPARDFYQEIEYCLHSLMFAEETDFTVIPTFHVFQMYLQHSGA